MPLTVNHYVEAEKALRTKVSEILEIEGLPSQFAEVRAPIMKSVTSERLMELQARTYALYCACAIVPMNCSEKRLALAFIAVKMKNVLYEKYKNLGNEFMNQVCKYSPTEDEIIKMLE